MPLLFTITPYSPSNPVQVPSAFIPIIIELGFVKDTLFDFNTNFCPFFNPEAIIPLLGFEVVLTVPLSLIFLDKDT